MPDNDLDDFITVNITCYQASALAIFLLITQQRGIWSEVLNPYQCMKLKEFGQAIILEIESQKLQYEEM